MSHHLTDTELLSLHFETSLATSRAEAGQHHLTGCATCQARHRAVTELLDEVSQAVEADSVFSTETLARQHGRIMARVAHESRTGKVISFPAAAAPVPVRYPRTGSRWVAAAMAAGVILGIVGEHLTQRITRTTFGTRGFERAVAAIPQPGLGVAVRTVSTGSDDEFLGQVELAFGSAGPATLRPLDALTPRAWDVRE
jgi:hypothetical protein